MIISASSYLAVWCQCISPLRRFGGVLATSCAKDEVAAWLLVLSMCWFVLGFTYYRLVKD